MKTQTVEHIEKQSNGIVLRLARRIAANPLVSDELALRILFWIRMGEKLNLNNPQTFNEKLQWLKLHDREPLYTKLVDKFAVKEWVAERIGEQYVVPTYGVWESFSDIDFSKLPNRFVLKCTHDSGGLVICRDKATFNLDAARKKIEQSLSRNYYWLKREWPYKDVPPRIIAEEYLDPIDMDSVPVGFETTNRQVAVSSLNNPHNKGMIDYKFYCFNGVPKFLYISQGLENHATANISFLTLDWEFAPFSRPDYTPFKELPNKPTCFDEMIQVATVLSAEIPFVRVDLYERHGNPLFSEMTFSPCSGFMKFDPKEWDKRIGEWIILPTFD